MSPRHPSCHPPSSGTGVAFGCVSDAPRPGMARLRLSGELDIATAPHLGEALSNMDDAVVVVVDLSHVTFIDSSGLHTILGAHTRMSDAKRRLVLVSGPPTVQRIFELTGTNQVLEFAEAPDAAGQRSSNGRSPNGATGSGPHASVDL